MSDFLFFRKKAVPRLDIFLKILKISGSMGIAVGDRTEVQIDQRSGSLRHIYNPETKYHNQSKMSVSTLNKHTSDIIKLHKIVRLNDEFYEFG